MNDKLSKILDEMIMLQASQDYEMAHFEADSLLCKALYEAASDKDKRLVLEILNRYHAIDKEYA